MPITFNCTCGKALRVPDAHAGRRAKCPACNAVVGIPAPEPEFEIVEDTPVPPSKAAAKPVTDDADDGGTYGLAPTERSRADDDTPQRKNRMPNFRKGREKYN